MREVLGTADGPSRRPRALVVAAALLAALLVGLLAADRVARDRETGALLDRVERAQSAVRAADARVAGTVTYGMPLIWSARTTPQVRAGLQRLVQDAAAGSVPALEQARRGVAGTRVLPWHGPQSRARQASVVWLDAATARLQAVARDAGALYEEHPDVAARRAEARQALLAAGRAEQVAELLAGER